MCSPRATPRHPLCPAFVPCKFPGAGVIFICALERAFRGPCHGPAFDLAEPKALASGTGLGRAGTRIIYDVM